MKKLKSNKTEIVKISDRAEKQIVKLLKDAPSQTIGLRLSLSNRGCNGMSYKLDFAKELQPLDEVVQKNGITLLIDPNAIMFVIGTIMDWQEDKLSDGFIFNNPNAASVCGCGESFYVDKDELGNLKIND